MAKCFGFLCFICGRERRASTPDSQTVSSPSSQQGPSEQAVPSPTSHQRGPLQETQPLPTTQQTGSSHETIPPPSLDEVIAQLKAVNDVSKVDELIKIIRDFLQCRTALKSVEDKAESSVASLFIDIGANFFKFLDNHAQKSSNKRDIMNSAPEIIGDVLEKLGNVHWLLAGLSVIGYMLHTADRMSVNYKRCLELLQKLVDLSDHVKKLNYNLPDEEDKLKRATVAIVKGCILCISLLSSHKLSRFLKASMNAEALSSLHKELDDLRGDLILTTVEQGPVTHPQIPPAYPVQSVGLAEGQEKVIQLLQLTSADTPRMAVVIYGFGGIGKTTLAEAVVAIIDLKPYHYVRVDFNIDSAKNDIKSMQEQILNGLFRNYTLGIETKLTNCSHGRAVLTEAFKKEGNKPIFLFIDNALRKQNLDELLPRNMKGLPKGSRILVTTRDLGATDMFIEDEAGLKRQQYFVKPLSDHDAKNFLLQGSADRQLDNIQERDVERILKTCKGVPLVLKIVRGHFRKQGYRADKCNLILEKLEKGKTIEQEGLSSTLTDFVYEQLEKSSQKAFLDICCFFNDMDPSYVEYIVEAQELTSLEEAAFVQRSDDKKTLIVHDIIRERGRNKAKSTRIMTVQSLVDAANEQRLKDIRGVWLKDEPECLVEERHLKAMTKLRVLVLGKRMKVRHRCEVIFEKLRYLEVGGDIPFLPVNLESLPKLAFYVGPLFKKGFSMFKLPKDLRVIIAARQSDFNGSTYLEESTSTVKNSSLEELDLSELKTLQKVPRGLLLLTSLKILRWNDWDRMEELSEEVCQLTMLTQLTLSGWTSLAYLPAGFGRLTSLMDLDLASCKALQCLPESFGQLKSLKYLDLYYCQALERLPESFGQLAAIEKLKLSLCTALQCLPESFGELKALKDLDLDSCKALERLPESCGHLAALENLKLRCCTALQCLPESFGELKALKDLDLDSCKALGLLPGSFGQLAAVEKLKLRWCTALQCLPESFGELKALKYLDLSHCNALERLPESFGQLVAVEKLELKSCAALKCLPESFGELKALKDLDLASCEALARLPESFGQLAAVEKLELSWCTAFRCLPESFGELKALKYLDLDSCKALERLPESFGQLAAVEELKLRWCTALQCLPESFGELKALKYLDLSFCKALKRLPASFGQLAATEELNLYNCRALKCLPESFGELKALKNLYLTHCTALERLPESFGQLAAVEKLKLNWCTALECLPESFGELKALKNLYLSHCKTLERLPESFGQHAALEKLKLSWCTALKCLPESFGKLTALEYLDLSSCEALNRLPRSFEELTSMLYINMADCPARADLRQFEANLKHVTIEL